MESSTLQNTIVPVTTTGRLAFTPLSLSEPVTIFSTPALSRSTIFVTITVSICPQPSSTVSTSNTFSSTPADTNSATISTTQSAATNEALSDSTKSLSTSSKSSILSTFPLASTSTSLSTPPLESIQSNITSILPTTNSIITGSSIDTLSTSSTPLTLDTTISLPVSSTALVTATTDNSQGGSMPLTTSQSESTSASGSQEHVPSSSTLVSDVSLSQESTSTSQQTYQVTVLPDTHTLLASSTFQPSISTAVSYAPCVLFCVPTVDTTLTTIAASLLSSTNVVGKGGSIPSSSSPIVIDHNNTISNASPSALTSFFTTSDTTELASTTFSKPTSMTMQKSNGTTASEHSALQAYNYPALPTNLASREVMNDQVQAREARSITESHPDFALALKCIIVLVGLILVVLMYAVVFLVIRKRKLHRRLDSPENGNKYKNRFREANSKK